MKTSKFAVIVSLILFFSINSVFAYTLGRYYPVSSLYHDTPSIVKEMNRTPILLVHGWSNSANPYSSNNLWGDLEDELILQGYDVWRVEYWPANLSNKKNANVVKKAIFDIRQLTGKSKINVISHSMGGLAVMGYINNMAIDANNVPQYYADDIDKYVIIASPIYGSYFSNIIDGATDINIFQDYPACKDFIEGDYFFQDTTFLGNTEASNDLEIGSDFTWELNNKQYNKNISYFSITGRETLERAIRPIPPALASFAYCLSNRWETNDGVVSLINSVFFKEGVPNVILDKFHTTQDSISKDSTAAKIISLFFQNKTDPSYINPLLNLTVRSGEDYFNSMNGIYSHWPAEFLNKGAIILQINGSEKDIKKITLIPSFGSNLINYDLEMNKNTERWFYINKSFIPNKNADFTTLMPSGSYWVYINSVKQSLIGINPGQVNLISINIDKDNDGYNDILAGGTDCDDSNRFVHPGATEFCDGIDNNCNGQIDENFHIGESCSNGIDNLVTGKYVCSRDSLSSYCFNQSNNCIIPLNSYPNLLNQTHRSLNLDQNFSVCLGVFKNIMNPFVIASSNITLDCNGAVLIGRGADTGVGIMMNGPSFGTSFSNITIKNCIIKNYWTGIEINSPSKDISFINNSIFNCSFGIYVYSSSNVTIQNSFFENNSLDGIGIQESNHSKIYNNLFINNGNITKNPSLTGLMLTSSINNTIFNNTFYGTGIYDNNQQNNLYCISSLGNNYFNGAIGPVCQCSQNWVWSNWSDCVNETQQRQGIDTNNCDLQNNLSLESRTCRNICIPNWILASDWTSCGLNDIQFKDWFDANNCNDLSTKPAQLSQQCNYCSPNLINSSWSDWQNQSQCSNNAQTQNRSKTEYDLNYNDCYAITHLPTDLWNNGDNMTIWDSRTISCTNICTPNLINSSWSIWTNTSCLSNNKMNQSRTLIQYDLNGCISNKTIREYQQVQSCNLPICTQSWSCSSWNSCNNGLQSRICTDNNNCNNLTGKPSETQTCSISCYQNWQCSDWDLAQGALRKEFAQI